MSLFKTVWDDAEVISSYSQAQAIEDGALIPVHQVAKEAGFKIPVLLTAGAWADCVAWPKEDGMQDEAGRLWDVVYMAMRGAIRNRGASEFLFELYRVPCGRRRAVSTQLKATIGRGDAGEPTIVIMLPNED